MTERPAARRKVRRAGPVKWCIWSADDLRDLAHDAPTSGYEFRFVDVRIWPGYWVGMFLTGRKRKAAGG